MAFFKFKNKLKNRIKSLENELGLIWVQDSYGDYVHVKEDAAWALLKRVDKLEEKDKK